MPNERVVYVVDDDDAVRTSASLLLEGVGYETESFESGTVFLDKVKSDRPGVVLLDINMPGLGGLEVQEALKSRGFHAFPVIVLTGQGDVGVAVRAMKNGAFEFIEKPYQNEALLDSVRNAFIQMESQAAEAARTEQAKALIAKLSNRELEVMRGLLAGLPNKLIAYELQISIRTVEMYRANVMDKLKARGLSAAVRTALAAGVQPLDERGAESAS